MAAITPLSRWSERKDSHLRPLGSRPSTLLLSYVLMGPETGFSPASSYVEKALWRFPFDGIGGAPRSPLLSLGASPNLLSYSDHNGGPAGYRPRVLQRSVVRLSLQSKLFSGPLGYVTRIELA